MTRHWIDTAYAAQVPTPPHPITLILRWLDAFEPGDLALGSPWEAQSIFKPSRGDAVRQLIDWLTDEIHKYDKEYEWARALGDQSEDFRRCLCGQLTCTEPHISPHSLRQQYMVVLRVRLRKLLDAPDAPVVAAAAAPVPPSPTVIHFPTHRATHLPGALPEAA